MVPADLLADPLTAAVALLKVRLHLIDGLGECLVASRASGAVAQPLGVPADLRRLLPELAADHVAAHAEQLAAEARSGVLERRRIAITAASAVEFELITIVGA